MTKVGVGIVLVLVLVTSAAWIIAAFSSVPKAPLSLHQWLPLPVACADARCVTYRRFSALVRSSGQGQDAAQVLTELLASKALSLVARRSGLRVSERDVDAALGALDELVAGQPEFRSFLTSQYEDTRSQRFRDGVRDLLLRRKLFAAGISSPWERVGAPAVTILHARYRWDETLHRVISR